MQEAVKPEEEKPAEKPAEKKEYAWASYKDEDLLKMRICDLGLELEGSEVAARVQLLASELESKGLQIRPKVYLGDEWFSPEGMIAIAVPFYLAHPRLIALEKTMMLEAEGEDPEYFMKLLRHEAGHCFDHAYKLSRRQQWRKLFGSPEIDYAPETYRPRPHSRSFVRNLENWYAQAHPDEDFAETFAVWLDPESNWRDRYLEWPIARSKLSYVDQLAKEVAKKAPKGEGGYLPYSATRLKTTLERHYAKKRKENAEQYPDFFDGDLRRIFNGTKDRPKRESGAAYFLKRHRKEILESVSYWTGEKKFRINDLIRKFIDRCSTLDLRTEQEEAREALEVAAYLATLVSNHLFTGRFKRSV